MKEYYINIALTDAKNKQYEAEFNHPDNRLKLGCKYSYSLNGVDYFIYNTYFKGHSICSCASATRQEIVADVLRIMETPINKIVNVI